MVKLCVTAYKTYEQHFQMQQTLFSLNCKTENLSLCSIYINTNVILLLFMALDGLKNNMIG